MYSSVFPNSMGILYFDTCYTESSLSNQVTKTFILTSPVAVYPLTSLSKIIKNVNNEL